MSTRGEANFTELPSIAAKLYDRLTSTPAVRTQVRQIAEEVSERAPVGRVLEVGHGPGRFLAELHELRPDIELHGLDVSDSMVRIAQQTLAEVGARPSLRVGSIRETIYEEGFFDVVTCTGSFYLWDEPEQCLDEVYRILRPGGVALLFESHRDIDRIAFLGGLVRNMSKTGIVHGLISPFFLLKQLRMTYSTDEVSAVISGTAFASHVSSSVRWVCLGGLPIWLRIELQKPFAV